MVVLSAGPCGSTPTPKVGVVFAYDRICLKRKVWLRIISHQTKTGKKECSNIPSNFEKKIHLCHLSIVQLNHATVGVEKIYSCYFLMVRFDGFAKSVFSILL